MIDDAIDLPDLERAHLLNSVFEPSTLDEVAVAVAVASVTERHLYVERLHDDRYRWSFTHPGGGYPLLRATAQFLRVDHTRITVPFKTVKDGVCIVCRDPREHSRAEKWAVIEFDEPTPPDVTRERIAEALGIARVVEMF